MSEGQDTPEMSQTMDKRSSKLDASYKKQMTEDNDLEPFKLDKINKEKNIAEEEVQLMLNRIKRLELEEERARKSIKNTKDKTLKMMEAKKRHQAELKKRNLIKKNKKKEEEAKREKFNKLRKERQEKIAQNKKEVERINKIKRDQTLVEKEKNLKAVETHKKLQQDEKAQINQEAQDARKKMIDKLNKIEEEKQNNSKTFYKKRVKEKGNKLGGNLKLLKMLEKKEKEIVERLKNTYHKQELEIKKLEEVENNSKQAYYERKPASPEHNRMGTTGASSSFQMSPKKENGDKDFTAKTAAIQENTKAEKKEEVKVEPTPQSQPKEEPKEEPKKPEIAKEDASDGIQENTGEEKDMGGDKNPPKASE